MPVDERSVVPEVLPRRPGYPLVVASLPGRSAQTLRGELQRAAEAGADLVEVRLDRLPVDEIPRLERLHELPLLHPWVPAIATLRSKQEGGEGPDDLPSRRRLFERALEAVPFSVVDLELARDLPLLGELREFEGRPLAFVVSAHLASDTPTPEVLDQLQRATRAGDVGKVVLPASAHRAVAELLPALKSPPRRPYVLHTTGGAGALLRVLAARLRMAWVYGRPPSADAGASVEASQVPVDRLRRFIDAGPETPWFILVGRPLDHSLSPDLHDTFLRSAGVSGLYVTVEISSDEELREVLPSLLPYGLAGVNVTRPLKRAAYDLAGKRSENASASGAVNTLVARADLPGSFMGYNTDVDALVRWWKELEGAGTEMDRVLVVGTGGAARAAVLASVLEGRQVTVLGRSRDAARALARDFPAESVRTGEASTLGRFPCVVHATPVGQARGTHLDLPLERALGSGSLLVDLVYRPQEPTLRSLAHASGASYVDGMRMLVYQAAESFRLFTGRDVAEETLGAWLSRSAEVEA